MISTATFCIIALVILDFIILYWIMTVNNKYKAYQSAESPICPVYYCDEIIDPSSGDNIPGSYCYTNTPGSSNVMTAFRYTDSSNTNYDCQSYNISDNIILTDETYQSPTILNGTST